MKIDDLVVPLFSETPIYYIYIIYKYHLHTSAMLLKAAPCRQVTVYEMPIGSPSTLVALKTGSFELQRTLSMTALGTPSPSLKKEVVRTAGYTNMPRYGYRVLFFCSFSFLWYHTTGFLHLRLDEFLFKWFLAPYRHPETHLAIIKSNHGLWEPCSFQVPFSACMNQLRVQKMLVSGRVRPWITSLQIMIWSKVPPLPINATLPLGVYSGPLFLGTMVVNNPWIQAGYFGWGWWWHCKWPKTLKAPYEKIWKRLVGSFLSLIVCLNFWRCRVEEGGLIDHKGGEDQTKLGKYW